MKHSKNEPTLFDKLMATHSEAEVRHYERVSGVVQSAFRLLRQTQRFVFDSDASFMLGQLIHKAAPLILREHDFARPPYDLTWVEIDFKAYITGCGRPQLEDKTADTRVGYFFNNGSLLIASETATTKPFISPLWYQLHTPVTFEEELASAQRFGMSRLTYRMSLIGDTGLNYEWWNTRAAADFCRAHKLMISSLLDTYPVDHMGRLLVSSAGSLKQGITIALLLTRPGQRVVTLHEQGHRHGIIRGKSRVLMAHRKVTIHLSVPKAVKRVVEALHSGLHRRYHAVRGHWCESRKNAGGCAHTWQWLDPDHAECVMPGCKAKRWWRHDCHRGDIHEGTVTKDYEVTE